jgi:alpha-galactosidase
MPEWKDRHRLLPDAVDPVEFGKDHISGSGTSLSRNIVYIWFNMRFHRSSRQYFSSVFLAALLFAAVFADAQPSFAAPAANHSPLAVTPPMGWNDWAHYQCKFTSQTILANANALVKTGLASHGYNTVTIDDCWMQKNRDAKGNLQVDPARFPQGMPAVIQAVHAMGLHFGIYEDAGSETCGGYAGSGEPKGGGKDHFLQDTQLFASWGVDYLKLDGCNVYVPAGTSQAAAYRKTYAAESAALKSASRPIVFSESAPAYFQDTPDWYDVLSWVRDYGQLWREGTDIATFDNKKPATSRFHSVLWNYAYNLPLGRFQKPGNWNDSDFIIGGDRGINKAETRSQMALWSMMSAPLILSSDLNRLSPMSIAILGNKKVIAIDQDALGRMATLVRRSPAMDVLFKPLNGGDYAIAVSNRSLAPISIKLRPSDLGFTAGADCLLDAQNLWTGTQKSATSLRAHVAAHDTAIWRIRASSSCGEPKRTGTITTIVKTKRENIESYSRCLAALGQVGRCAGTPAETWTVSDNGTLESGGKCLAVVGEKPAMQDCNSGSIPRWKYTLVGNLIAANGECLTASGRHGLAMQACGHNRPDQIWSLPNGR